MSLESLEPRQLLSGDPGGVKGTVFGSPATSYVGDVTPKPYPVSLVAANLNADNLADIAMVNSSTLTTNNLSILLNSAAGYPASATMIAGGNKPQSVAAGDLNGDGRQDLVTACWQVDGASTMGGVAVLLQQSDGSFAAPVIYPTGMDRAKSVAVEDFNGDSIPDVVAANWVGNGTAGQFGSIGLLTGKDDGAGKGDGTLNASIVTTTNGIAPWHLQVADINGDNHPDVAVANRGLNASDSFGNYGSGRGVSVLLWDPDNAKFADGVLYDTGCVDTSASFEQPSSVAVGDFNGDGRQDLAVANMSSDYTYNSVGVVLNQGDANHDGQLEFSAAHAYSTQGLSTFAVVSADFDGNGKRDLAAVNSVGCQVALLSGLGDGTFDDVNIDFSDTGGVPGQFPEVCPAAIAADLNGDGKSDLAVLNQGNRTVGVLLNQASSFAPTDILLDNDTIPEAQPLGTLVGHLTAVDPDLGDTHTFTLVTGSGGDDNSYFQVIGNELQTKKILDFETKTSYSIRVRATDSSNPPQSLDKVFTINVTDEILPPTDITVTPNKFDEGLTVATIVGKLDTVDDEPPNGLPPNWYSYALATGDGGEDNALFDIVNDPTNGWVVMTKAPTNPGDPSLYDYETKTAFSILVTTTVQSTGGPIAGETATKPVVLYLNDVNAAPSALQLTANTVDENLPANTVVGTFTATDDELPADPFQFTLVGGAGSEGNGYFYLDQDTGELRTNAVFDYEQKSSYSIRVQVADSAVPPMTYEAVFTITINDKTAPPTDIQLVPDSIDERNAAGAVIGEIVPYDDELPAAPHDCALVAGLGGDDNDFFTLSMDGSKWMLHAKNSLDFETKSEYTIRVRATDDGGLSFEKAIIIHVNDVNLQPTDITLTSYSINEGRAAGAVVGTFDTVDPDAPANPFTYALVDTANFPGNAKFNLEHDLRTDEWHLVTTELFDYELISPKYFDIRVQSTDAGLLSIVKTIRINVLDVSGVPTGIILDNDNVDENKPAGTVVGKFTTEDTESPHDKGFDMVFVPGDGSDDNGSFNLVPTADNTAWNLTAKSSFNFEALPDDQKYFSVRVRSTNVQTQLDDPLGTHWIEQSFTIFVNNINTLPDTISLSNTLVEEYVGDVSNWVPVKVGTFSLVDTEQPFGPYQYSLTSGTGSGGNYAFSIQNTNELWTSIPLSAQGQTSYPILVRVTDSDPPLQIYRDYSFVITVTRLDYPPDGGPGGPYDVNEGSTLVFSGAWATDQDAGDVLTYSWDLNNDGQYGDSTELHPSVFYPNGPATYEVSLRITDSRGASKTDHATVYVHNVDPVVNAGPNQTALPGQSVQFHGSYTDPGVNDTVSKIVWDFGPMSQETTDLNPTYAFAMSGTYFVSLQVTDSDGGIGYGSMTVVVANNAPEVHIDQDLNRTGLPGEELTFNGRFADPDDPGPWTYDWDFGDGSTHVTGTTDPGDQTVPSASHTYPTKGTYPVTLKVTDSGMGSPSDVKWASKTISAVIAPPAPAGSLDVDQSGAVVGLQDGLLILRYMLGFRGATLTKGVVDTINGKRTAAADIAAYLSGLETTMLDVDGNGAMVGLQDGLLILRYMLSYRGPTLVKGVVDLVKGTRTTSADIVAFLDQFNVPGKSGSESPAAKAESSKSADLLSAASAVSPWQSSDADLLRRPASRATRLRLFDEALAAY